MSRDLLALGPAETAEPVDALRSTPGSIPERTLESSPESTPTAGEPPPRVANSAGNNAADSAWSWPHQRAPRIFAIVIVLTFAAVSAGYVHLVAAADRPAGIGTHRPVYPSGAPSHRGAVPNGGSFDHFGPAPARPKAGVPSDSPDASTPDASTPSDEPVPSTEPPADPADPPAIPVDPVGTDNPAPPELTATVATSVRLLPPGYVGQVTVSNVGDATAVGWRVSLSIGGHARVSAASGVGFQQVGTVVTFAPGDAILRIQPGRSVRFQFRVRGIRADTPTNCLINGVPC